MAAGQRGGGAAALGRPGGPAGAPAAGGALHGGAAGAGQRLPRRARPGGAAGARCAGPHARGALPAPAPVAGGAPLRRPGGGVSVRAPRVAPGARACPPANPAGRRARSSASRLPARDRGRVARAAPGARARLQGHCLKKRARVRGGRAPLVCGGEQSKHERPNPLRCPGDVRCTASSRAAGTATQVSAGCAIAIVPLSQPWPCFTCCWTFAQRWASACPLMQHCAECALRQCVEQGMPGLVLSWLSWHALMPRTPEECCTPWLAGVVMAWACVSLTRSAQYGSQGLQWTPSGTSCAPWRRTSRATMPPLRWSAPMQRAR